MNVVDLLIIGVIAVTIALGWRAGLISQAFGLLGAGLAIVALVLLAPTAADALEGFDPLTRPIIVIIAFFLAVAIGQGIGGRIAAAVRPRQPGALRTLDSAWGAAFGLAQGVILVWLMGGILAAAPFPGLSVEARRSVVLREFDARLPSPVALVAEVGRLLDSSGLPDVFIGITPPPPAPADTPAQRDAERIAADARGSIVRVEAVACLQLQSGTGFSVAPGVFVTNAHVVAGAADVELSVDGRFDRFDADVVLFDPDLDLAVLRAPGLELQPLSIATAAPERGDAGAALGHTGGGRLRAVPAIVNRTLEAIGRDVYGRGTVSRDVVELRSDVAQGDSGGPLILTDGTVGGVIFSESQADRTVGYALSPGAVAGPIRSALGRTEAVDTGACTD